MKKAANILLSIFAVVVLFLLNGCSLFYHLVEFPDEKLDVGINKYKGECFAAHYYWDGDTSNMTVVLKEEYNGYTLTELGGYFGRGVPSPFEIIMPDEFEGGTMKSVESYDDYEVTELVFTVTVPKTLKSVTYLSDFNYYVYEFPSGETKMYSVNMYFECDGLNPYLYSENGKLKAR